jgi:TorA maturation chaperone TorD
MDTDIPIRLTELETESAIFQLLAAFYNINPCGELVDAAKELVAEGIDDEGLAKAISLIVNYGGASAGDDEILELKRDWTKLFRGVSPDYGPKPPYEELFSPWELTELMGELAKVYTANGFTPSGERHDYIGVELSFAAHLSALRVESFKEGDLESVERYGEILGEFLENHPKKWFKRFCDAAFPKVSTEFYRGVLQLTTLTIDAT